MNELELAELHRRLLVIDGLVFFSDGDAEGLKAGNVAAANVTISTTAASFEEAIKDILEWKARCGEPDGLWKHIEHAADIEAARAAGKVGLIMGWQSPRPLADRVERIALFHGLGLRVVQMTYNYAELCGDGCLEPRNAGLSRLGFTFVEEMNRVGIAIDLSHVGERTTLDVTRASKVPVLLTHANAKAIHDRPRNKSDEVMKAVAATGGVVGLSIHGFMNWGNDPSTPPSLAGFVEQVRYAVNLVGIDHVGFGTDFASVRDPAATAAILDMSFTKFAGATADYVLAFGNTLEKRYPDEINHPRFMHRKTDALVRGGFTEGEVEKIMGGNMLRAFADIWG